MTRFVNLDMDGVVADFNLYCGHILGREIGWEGRDLSDAEWITLSRISHLYNRLPVILESKYLVRLAQDLSSSYNFNLRFLTAIPRRTSIPEAEQDKRDWINTYFPGIPVEVGPFSKDKQKWCNELDVLVDDKYSNVKEWADRGGISVYHTGNWNATFLNFYKAITSQTPSVIFN